MERNNVDVEEESLLGGEERDDAPSDGGGVDTIISLCKVAAGVADDGCGCGPPSFTTDAIAPDDDDEGVDTPLTSMRSARSSRKDSSFGCDCCSCLPRSSSRPPLLSSSPRANVASPETSNAVAGSCVVDVMVAVGVGVDGCFSCCC